VIRESGQTIIELELELDNGNTERNVQKSIWPTPVIYSSGYCHIRVRGLGKFNGFSCTSYT